MKKKLIIILILVFITGIIWIPALVLAAKDDFDKYRYYIKALEYMLYGLEKYFDAIIRLFVEAVK